VKEDQTLQTYYKGMRINKNIYNQTGTLVIPTLSILTDKDIYLLYQQKVELSNEDVEPAAVLEIVDSAIKEVKDLFLTAACSDQISFTIVREKILPIIIFMSHHPSLNQILTHLEHHDEYVYRHSIGVALLSRIICRRVRAREETYGFRL
jgi:HD-GYP domain-containing protein (c-di-GMP phosphodiesterase class II)